MRAFQRFGGAVAIFYVLAWGASLLGQAGWESTAPQCAYTAANTLCQVDGRIYVSWTSYPYIRPILNGDVPVGNPGGGRHRNPRARLAMAMFSMYRGMQGAQLVEQADRLPRVCGGFYIEIQTGPLLLPALKAVPSCG